MNHTNQLRSQQVYASLYNKFIPHHPRAGQIEGGKIWLHNGIQVYCHSYCDIVLEWLRHNKGVHEPSNEFWFGSVLSLLPEGATIFEWGCCWSMYSIWLLRAIKNSKAVLTDVNRGHMNHGIENAQLNDVYDRCTFHDITPQTLPDEISKDAFDVLILDCDGCENYFLTNWSGQAKWMFVSTHNQELHSQCLDIICKTHTILLEEQELHEDGHIIAGLRI